MFINLVLFNHLVLFLYVVIVLLNHLVLFLYVVIVLFNHLVLFMIFVWFVTLIYCVILYTCGDHIHLHASIHIFLDAVQHPPPLHELLAHVEPQQPLLHAFLHLSSVFFLFSHPTFHDLIWNALFLDLTNLLLGGIDSLHRSSSGAAASSYCVTVTFT